MPSDCTDETYEPWNDQFGSLMKFLNIVKTVASGSTGLF